MTAAEWSSLVQSLAWSMLGFVLGYFLGRATGEVHIVNVKTDEDYRVPNHRRFDVVVGTSVIILSILSVILASMAISRRGDQVACQSQYNAAVADALRARTEAANEDRTALTKLVSGVAQSKSSEDTLRALNQYLATTRKTEQDRAETPLPDPLREVCN